MTELYNYKVWNPDLSQFVARPDLRTEAEIRSLGGVIIPSGPRSTFPPAIYARTATGLELASSP